MGAFAAMFTALGALLSRLVFTQGGAWAISILAGLGLALGTQSLVMGPIVDYASSGFAGLPSVVADWVGMLNIDKYVSIVLSAYAAASIKGVLLRRTGA